MRSHAFRATLLCALLAAGCGGERITDLDCTHSPEVATALARSEALRGECGPDLECRDKALADILAVRDRHPREIGAHIAVIQARPWVPDAEETSPWGPVRREYARRLQERPDDPALLLLESILAQAPGWRRSLLERALAVAPDFSWAHAGMASSLSAGKAPGEKAEALEHFEVFADACPGETSRLLRLVARLGDSALFERWAPRLRIAIRPESDAFALLPELWNAELRTASPDRHAAVRERIAADVEQLAALERTDDRLWLGALEAGYELLGDDGGRGRVEELWLNRHPCDWNAIRIATARLSAELPAPPKDAEPAIAGAWGEAMLSRLDPLWRRCPASELLAAKRFHALAAIEAPPEPELIAAGEPLLAVSAVRLYPSNPGAVAEVWIRHRAGLERVPALLEADLLDAVKRERERRERAENDQDLADAEASFLQRRLANSRLRALHALAGISADGAEAPLAELAAGLEELATAASDPQGRQELAWTEAGYWHLRAEQALLRGEDETALAAYRESLARVPEDGAVQRGARAHWKHLGRPESEFATWLAEARRSAVERRELSQRAARRPVGDFRWTDLEGREWTQASLAGRTTLLNFWTTWCGPCVQEVPHLNDLYADLRADDRFVVLGVNLDENPGLVAPFAARQGIRYPVVLAGSAAMEDWAPDGIPLTLIVDPSGTVVWEQLGFGGDGSEWLAQITAGLEAASGGTASPAPTPGS